MALTAQRRVEYRRFRNGVNRLAPPAPFLSLMWILVLLCGGCATTPDAGQCKCRIAVRYDVEPRLIGGGLSQEDGAIRSDFKSIAKLGFGGVVLQHVEDGDRRRLLELADEVGLKAAVPDRRFDRFVVTGGLPPNCRDENELVRDSNLAPKATDEIIHHPAFDGYLVEKGRGSAAGERSRRLRAQLVHHGVLCIVPGSNDASIAVIDAAAVRVGSPGTAIERVLALYHAALSAGQTGGVIVDRFLRLPGDPPGLTSPDEPLLPAHLSAITALIQRARCWGQILYGLPATTLAMEELESSPLRVTVLGRGSRSYVLIFNTSTERFAREEVQLPASILDRSALRAVEVPPSSDLGAGRVIHSQRGRLAIPIELRPGDAALFELLSTAR